VARALSNGCGTVQEVVPDAQLTLKASVNANKISKILIAKFHTKKKERSAT